MLKAADGFSVSSREIAPPRLAWVMLRWVALRRVLGWFLVGIAPVWAVLFLAKANHKKALGFDLVAITLRASNAFVHGQSLYLRPEQWHHVNEAHFAYVYPPLYAEVLAPLLALPVHAVILAAAIVCLACVFLSLRILGVRDPRVFAAALVSWPVVFGTQVENASMVVLLLLAVAWKRGALPVAGAIAIKLFAWPLIAWLWFTRGARSAIVCAAATAALLLAGWAAVGFEGMTAYPGTLESNSDAVAGTTYGFSTAFAHGQIIAVALTVLALLASRRRAQVGDDVGCFAYAIGAGLAFSPITWAHYLVLLLIPLALRRPTFSPVWLLAPATWLIGPGFPTGLDAKIPVWLVVGALVVWLGQDYTVLRLSRAIADPAS